MSSVGFEPAILAIERLETTLCTERLPGSAMERPDELPVCVVAEQLNDRCTGVLISP